MERVDIAIIGTGPAGVSAAITASLRNKSVLLLGSGELSEKLLRAHEIRNYPGFPAVSGAELARAFREHLEKAGLAVTEKRVVAVYASAVILATGVTAGKPLPGETELLGRGVSYCATCDAALYRGKEVAVIGFSPREEAEAAFLNEVCSRVLYFPQYKEEPQLPDSVEIIRGAVKAVEEREGHRAVITESGVYVADGVFILREAVAPGQLVPGLETEGAHVVVNRRMETNLPGLFACGDLTGTPYQYVKAAGEGNIAALSAVSFLDQRKHAPA